MEQRLRTSVVTSLMSTMGTGLACVPRVYSLDMNTALLSLVGNKAIELRKRPTVQFALVVNVLVGFAASYRGRFSNIGEIFQDESSSYERTLDNLFGENMVTIPVKSHLLVRHLFEMSFGRLGSFGLQFAFEAKRATVNLFPSLVPKKLFLRGDSRAIESEVNTNHHVTVRDRRFGDGEDDVQAPLALFVDEVCGGIWIAHILLTEVRHRKRDDSTSFNGRQTHHALCPIEAVGTLVVANRTQRTLWTLDRRVPSFMPALFPGLLHLFEMFRVVLLFPGQGTFQRFGCFETGLNENIGVQRGELFAHGRVRGMVQLDPVLFVDVPSVATDCIEDFRKLLHGLCKQLCLFGCGMKLYLYRSIHTENIAYIQRNCKYRKISQEREKGGARFHPIA